MITLDQIHLEYKHTLIKDGHMDIPYGSITLICGESGLGKTTLLETIGLLTDIKCSYIFDNIELKGINQNKRSQIMQNDIAFIFQDVYLFEHMSLKENILFYARMANKEINDDMIYEYMNRLSLHLDIVNNDIMTKEIVFTNVCSIDNNVGMILYLMFHFFNVTILMIIMVPI